MKNLGRFLKTTVGNFVACLVITIVVQGFLNQDFWNYGVQKLHFGWMPGSFLYRFLLLFVLGPASLYLLVKFCWPNYEAEDDQSETEKED